MYDMHLKRARSALHVLWLNLGVWDELLINHEVKQSAS